uniref:Ovule protein n=1 Tax=Panagrolaimus sp. ES5 TaxID=591445 RepID=A0AC34FNX6_9BILA
MLHLPQLQLLFNNNNLNKLMPQHLHQFMLQPQLLNNNPKHILLLHQPPNKPMFNNNLQLHNNMLLHKELIDKLSVFN